MNNHHTHDGPSHFSLDGPSRRLDRTLVALIAIAAVTLTFGFVAVFALGEPSQPVVSPEPADEHVEPADN